MNLIALIDRIEAEIKLEYLGDAINWADKTYDGAWSNALNRFDTALSQAIKNVNYQYAKQEGAVYLETVKGLLTKYREHKQDSEVDSFIASLGANRRFA